jgi:hypothetical protein
VEQERRNGRWLVIVIVSFIGVVVAWGWYLLFIVGQK